MDQLVNNQMRYNLRPRKLLMSANTPKGRLSETTGRFNPRFQEGIRFRASLTSKVTTPRPFTFEARDRTRLLQRRALEESAVKERKRIANSFRARPMPIGPPDTLPPANRAPPTTAKSPVFATNSRVARRLVFDERLRAKRASLDRRFAVAKAKRDAEAELAVKELRKGLVHRPEPVRSYKAISTVARKSPTRIHPFKLSKM